MRVIALGAAAAAIALATATCGRKAEHSATEAAVGPAVVNVYNWSDYIDPAVIERFTAETGIQVRYDVFDSNEVLETKLLTGHSGYDLVVPTAYFLERQVKAGVFRPLDRSKLPNLVNIDPGIARLAAAHDPGNEHGVVYMWGTTGIGYDAGKVAALMPDAPVDSWNFVFDPKVISRFKDCGISVLDDPTDMVATMLLWLGKDPNSEDEGDLRLAEERLLAIRPFVRTIHSSHAQLRDDPSIYPPADVKSRLRPNLAKSPEFTRNLNRTWTRFTTGR